MLLNYLKIAWRNMKRNKAFTSINIIGLASGLACFILIALYVTNELSYDRYNDKADRIYRINSFIRFGGSDLKLAVTCDPMGATLKKDYPEVEQFVRFYNSNGSKLIKKGSEYLEERKVAHADSTLFSVFTLPAIAGDTRTALNEPNTVVITETTAQKYFGSTNVVGKTIETNEAPPNLYKITAVLKDMPTTSHFNFDFIFSMDNLKYPFGDYLSQNFQTYLLLKPGTDPKAFEKNFVQFTAKYILPQVRQFMNIKSMDEFKKSGNLLEYSLMPLLDIHLHSDMVPELGVNGNIQYVYIFSAVALFILLIACINFVNLSTARSANRAKEVGIRKVLGTQRKNLIGQFLTESVLTAFMAMAIALLISILVLPYFNNLAGKELIISDVINLKTVPFLLLLPLVAGIVAGSYPAIYLSSFQPVKVLKGTLTGGVKGSRLRSILVIFQFATSIILIIATIVVSTQLNYIQNKKLGFNKDQVLVINGTSALKNNKNAFKEEVAKMPGVVNSSFAGYLPVSGSSRSDNTYSKEAVASVKSSLRMQSWSVDYDYLRTLGMEMKSGRTFLREYGTDSSSVIINETTAGILGYPDPIGKKIYTLANGPQQIATSYTIIGVVKNFHIESMKQNIGPLCFLLGDNTWSTTFRINTKETKPLLAKIEAKWKSMAPGMPFNYQFLDEAFDNMYRAEQRVGKVAISFAIIAILIACLGLFGLATFMAEQRTKEIGVRKVLGATVNNILTMLSSDFLKLVCIAALIAFPFAWWAMHSWLQNFAFRISISWWIFVVAGLVAFVIAMGTISFQAIKAAIANPVKSLRAE